MQSRSSTRRRWLRWLGLATTGIAGCLTRRGSLGGGGTSTPDSTPTRTSPTEHPTTSPERTDGTEASPTETGEATETRTPLEPDWWIPRGQVLDAFETFDADWTVVDGQARASTDGSFGGGQAATVSSAGEKRLRIERWFEQPRDFRDVGFSMAVCLHETTSEIVQLNLILVDEAGDRRALSGSIQPGATDRWVRFDLGVRDDEGAEMGAIEAIRVEEWTGDDETTVTVDDIRLHPKPDVGYVMFTFDDGAAADYSVAYPTLRRQGYAGACFPPIARVTESSSPSIAEYREMRDDGWDIGGHTLDHEDLTDHTRNEQRAIIAENYRQLHEKDLAREITHFRTPYSNYDSHSLDLMTESFDTAVIGAGSATGTNLAITDPRTIGFRSGDELEEAKRLVDAAAKYQQLLGITLHMHDVDRAHLEALVDHVRRHERRGRLRVVTPTELYRRAF